MPPALRATLPLDFFALELFDEDFPARGALEVFRLLLRDEAEDLDERPTVFAARFTADPALTAAFLIVFFAAGLAAPRLPRALAA